MFGVSSVANLAIKQKYIFLEIIFVCYNEPYISEIGYIWVYYK